MNRIKRATALLCAVAGMSLTLTACNNTQTTAAECAYVISNGYFDAKHIKDFVLPGNRVNTHNTQVKYVPCNARNFIVTTRAGDFDRHEPVAAKTAPGKNQPAM